MKGAASTFTAPAIIITSDAITACTSPAWRARHAAAVGRTAPAGTGGQLAADAGQQAQHGLAQQHGADAGQQHKQRRQIGGAAQHFLGLDGKRRGDAAHGQAFFQLFGQAEPLGKRTEVPMDTTAGHQHAGGNRHPVLAQQLAVSYSGSANATVVGPSSQTSQWVWA
jgi:hypothetical protein